MNKQIKLIQFVVIIGLTIFTTAQAQKFVPKSYELIISGTTNVHDYETKVTQMTGELIMTNPNQAKSLIINIPVKSIKSKEKLMDTKTYEAFESEKYPNISFKLVEVQSLQYNGSDLNVTVAGNLTIHGVTKKVILKSAGKLLKAGVYQFKGAIAMKMTDFGMKPPTAMMGMMKVGDGVTLKYTVVFEEQN